MKQNQNLDSMFFMCSASGMSLRCLERYIGDGRKSTSYTNNVRISKRTMSIIQNGMTPLKMVSAEILPTTRLGVKTSRTSGEVDRPEIERAIEPAVHHEEQRLSQSDATQCYRVHVSPF